MKPAWLLLLLVSLDGVAQADLMKSDPAAVKAATKSFPTAVWDAILKKYTDAEGRVRYAAVDRKALQAVFAALAASSPATDPTLYKSKAAQLAYYLNGYNLCVWMNVISRLPKMRSVNDESESFFGTTTFPFGGREMSLRTLENDVVRKQFGDPRVHMALNCASGGCPKLPRYAFSADKLDAQLDNEAKRFCNEKRNVDFDDATKTVKLSKIFEWYKDDFGGSPEKVIAWINRYRDAQIPTDAKPSYLEYDWRLNDPSLPR